MIDRPQHHALTLVRKGWARPLWQQLRRGRGNVHEKNSCGDTLLLQASYDGNVYCARVLLAHGANVNVSDNGQWAPLHYAAWRGHAACVHVLLLNGADVNAQDNMGWTPLHLAAALGNESCVRVLLAQGANVHAKKWDGETPLNLAIHNNYQDVCELLRAAMTRC